MRQRWRARHFVPAASSGSIGALDLSRERVQVPSQLTAVPRYSVMSNDGAPVTAPVHGFQLKYIDNDKVFFFNFNLYYIYLYYSCLGLSIFLWRTKSVLDLPEICKW